MTDGEGNAKHRIIPMRVGTSAPVFFFNFRLRDHPHACGDKAQILCRP